MEAFTRFRTNLNLRKDKPLIVDVYGPDLLLLHRVVLNGQVTMSANDICCARRLRSPSPAVASLMPSRTPSSSGSPSWVGGFLLVVEPTSLEHHRSRSTARSS
jgi:hypothetical protein